MMIDANILFTGGYDATIKLTVNILNHYNLVFANILAIDMFEWTWRGDFAFIDDRIDWAFGEFIVLRDNNVLGLSSVENSEGNLINDFRK